MDQSKKERLRRLSEMNMRAMGVSSFEALGAKLVCCAKSSADRELLADIRKKQSFVRLRFAEESGRLSVNRPAWVRKYYNL